MGHDGAAGNIRLDRLPSSREIFGLCQYCDELWTNRGVVCIIGSVSTHSSSSSNSLYRLRVLPVPPSYAISSTGQRVTYELTVITLKTVRRRSSVVITSVYGQRTIPEWPMPDHGRWPLWVNCPLWANQLSQLILSLPVPLGSVNE